MTEKRFDVTALGEILIDFTEWGFSDAGTRLFAQNPGGAVANVAAAVARLGGRAAFVGKVGADMHGAFLRQTLQEAGVDVSGLATDAERFTTLAFVKLAENGERSFSFARHDAADTGLRWEEVPQPLLTDTRVLAVGTLGMTDEPMRTTQLRCIEAAKAAGAYIALDPNYRASLWRGEGDFLRQTERLLALADYVKLSDEETALVTGKAHPQDALEVLAGRGVKTAVVTLGKVEVYNKRGKPMPEGWTIDGEGRPCSDARRMNQSILAGELGGILPLGGEGETTSGHKGYGLAIMVEALTGVLAQGMLSPEMCGAHGDHTSHFFMAFDPAMFGDPAAIRARMSGYLQALRESEKAPGYPRIYTPGEKAHEAQRDRLQNGVPVEENTLAELRQIARELGIEGV